MILFIRQATTNDIAILVAFRKQLLRDEGQEEAMDIDASLTQYFQHHLQTSDYVQLIVEVDEQCVATGAIHYMQFPPSFKNTKGIRGYIANMYTAENARGNGYAKQILQSLLADAQTRHVEQLFLMTSPMGRALYQKIGFHDDPTFMNYHLSY